MNASVPIPPPPPSPQASTAASGLPSFAPPYAGFLRRLFAVIIDDIFISIISFVISLPFGLVNMLILSGNSGMEFPIMMTLNIISQITLIAFAVIYPVYFIAKKGATPGKMILGIKVIRKDATGEIGYTNAFLRESIGKFISGIAFGLGYITMVKDPYKQTWHDKLAKTIVIRGK